MVAHLPSPYYHFEYEPDGRIKRVSFASDFLIYDVLYQDGRIAELRNDTAGNMDRLQYVYDAAGRVDTVNYLKPTGTVFARVGLTYDGDKLSKLDRERQLETGRWHPARMPIAKTTLMARSRPPPGSILEPEQLGLELPGVAALTDKQ